MKDSPSRASVGHIGWSGNVKTTRKPLPLELPGDITVNAEDLALVLDWVEVSGCKPAVDAYHRLRAALSQHPTPTPVAGEVRPDA